MFLLLKLNNLSILPSTIEMFSSFEISSFDFLVPDFEDSGLIPSLLISTSLISLLYSLEFYFYPIILDLNYHLVYK